MSDKEKIAEALSEGRERRYQYTLVKGENVVIPVEPRRETSGHIEIKHPDPNDATKREYHFVSRESSRAISLPDLAELLTGTRKPKYEDVHSWKVSCIAGLQTRATQEPININTMVDSVYGVVNDLVQHLGYQSEEVDFLPTVVDIDVG